MKKLIAILVVTFLVPSYWTHASGFFDGSTSLSSPYIGITGGQSVIGWFYYTGTSTGKHGIIEFQVSGTVNFWTSVELTPSAGTQRLTIDAGDAAANNCAGTITGTISTSTWYGFLATFPTSGAYKGFVWKTDGSLATNSSGGVGCTRVAAVKTCVGTLNEAGSACTTAGNWNGMLRNIMVFERVLNVAQARAILFSSNPLAAPGMPPKFWVPLSTAGDTRELVIGKNRSLSGASGAMLLGREGPLNHPL